MKQSKLFGKTTKDAPKDEVSVNANLLHRAGFIDKLMAGAYSYLPLGLKVLDKVKNIVREEIDAIEGQEILMPALQSRELWDKTGRWEKLKEVMFQFKGRGGADIGLAATHEEVITEIVSKRVKSYKDLPIFLYQIQDKFRNEPRAKSGLLRGREFSMKDLYSFHTDENDFEQYYERAKKAYLNIFNRCGLDAKIVEAAGGDFTSKMTHEFQVICDSGEDTIFYCNNCDFAQNHEIALVKNDDKCPKCNGLITLAKSIEVGNIFPLETTYSKPLNLKYTDKDGKQKIVVMGSYGVGPSRVVGTVVEVHHDDKGIVWPMQIAPFQVHLVQLGDKEEVATATEEIYKELQKSNIEVLHDDRQESAGVKFSDSDLIGLPIRIVVSEKTLAQNCVELKLRKVQSEDQAQLIKINELGKTLLSLINK